MMERIVRKSRRFSSAARWDVRQQAEMTPSERIRAARALRDRVYGTKTPDVRQCRGKW